MAAEVDTAKYEKWAWPHPMVVFWMLNPVAVFNELLVGQRMPKVLLIDKTMNKPWMERSFVPCPHCDAMHDGRLWSWSNAYGHWFGYVCPSCGGVIPCLWSLASLLVLAVTFPVWALPVHLWKKQWLEFEKRRVLAAQQKKRVDAADVPWMKLGVLWMGGVCWLAIGVVPEVVLVPYGQAIDWLRVLIALPCALLGGALWGHFMKYYMSRRPSPSVSGAK